MRDPAPSTLAQAAARDETRLRELDRKQTVSPTDLTTTVAALPAGVVARNYRTTSPPTTAGNSQPVLSCSATVVVGRLYRVSAPMLQCYANGATGICVVEGHITYTTDGTTPAVGSPMLRRGDINVDTGAHGVTLSMAVTWPSTIAGILSVQLSYVGAVLGGASSVGIVGSTENPIELIIEDLGVDPGLTGTIY